ncbi:PAS domain-containing methyl-accepting chemotaxis protein [Oceanisphaera sediminis]|uniref:PAS domain-containing methyl-accepting chemotaxis protein n=1 Tax=Oceanisphaera sediminis TaxID=981381 RepID=A0ABP7DSX7_9GAMM
MRKNVPVTQTERTFPSTEKLISSTDIQGNILHCNDAFVAVSGYSREELIGQPHNIVRHPDMPPLAFRIMWEHLKAGKPWMGMVKNRCKNGDYYWVDAYVTAITESGNVIGFESVRSCPNREDIARAEQFYTHGHKVRDMSRVGSMALQSLPWLVGVGGAGIVFGMGHVTGSLAWLSLSIAVYALVCNLGHRRIMQQIDALLGDAFRHELAVTTYTRDSGLLGRIKVGICSEKARLNAVVTRVEDAARQVTHQSEAGLGLSRQATSGIQRQQQETEMVATAMHQMTTTINDVSGHVQETARQAETSNELAIQGREVALTTRKSIEQLRQTVEDIRGSVLQLSEQTGRIAQVAMMIEQIAGQTNLLALNAAIEAARAGEHGRGFAVVADEVRQLAQRTQHSTSEIHQILDAFKQQAVTSVQAAEHGREDAEAGLARVMETENMLSGISAAVGTIANMSSQMATAVGEQAHVAGDINVQLNNISVLSRSSLARADEASSSMEGLQSVSDGLYDLLIRLRR